MSLATPLNQLPVNLSADQQQALQQGEVVVVGSAGDYTVLSLVPASAETVWNVLTNYEQFPDFLPSVVASQVLERHDNRVLVERKDRRKVGFMPIRVKIVTENIEHYPDRIDYRMVKGTLDEMNGTWELTSITEADGVDATLLTQTISAKASLGPLQPYFYEVFETGLQEMTAGLQSEMQRRNNAQ
ncbi:MAG: SRPBCC family protein [Cyanobacteria bacterium P01_C01_bin.120]